MKGIGIDPGCTGAMVLIDNGQPVEWETMPCLKVELWPAWRVLGTKARGQALADAALIALHGGAVIGGI